MSATPEPIRRPGAGEGTVLAFDFGTRKIGVAVGNTTVRLAHPLTTIRSEATAVRFAAIAALLDEWRPDALVVGRPTHADGVAHETTARAERFARQLEGRFGLPVARVDESYSSLEAESRVRAAGGGRTAVRLARGRALDSYAAQLILEQYFDEAAA
jgi:putative holliday junction resolvase